MRTGKNTRPFRAPRSTDGKTAAKASPTRQSPRRDKGKTDTTQHDRDDSEGPTELRVARWVVKETEESAQEETDRHSETKTDTHSDDVDENGQRWTIESRKKRADILRGGAPSPCLAEFEEFLAVKSARVPQNILSDASSSDDEVPIVSTLRAAKAKGQIKKQKAPLWVYETVKEPTGVASKYWDAEPPSERATKRLAKLKLSLVNATNDEHSGINMPLALANNVFLLKIFVMSIPF